MHDKATVSGQVGSLAITGSVDFTFYTSSDCSTGGSASGSGVALVSGVADPSSSQGPLAAGSYSFKAHYNGSTNYAVADSACEPLTVQQATPTVATEIHNGSNHSAGVTSVALGSTVHDKATFPARWAASRSRARSTSPSTRVRIATTGGSASGSGVALVSGVADPSSSQGPLGAGSYSFKAHYNGSTNYAVADRRVSR